MGLKIFVPIKVKNTPSGPYKYVRYLELRETTE
jgi:hypothetical protein